MDCTADALVHNSVLVSDEDHVTLNSVMYDENFPRPPLTADIRYVFVSCNTYLLWMGSKMFLMFL